MNKQKMIDIENGSHHNILRALNAIPDELAEYMSQAVDGKFFFKECSVEDMMKRIKGKKYKLSRYYASHSENESLAVVYIIDRIDWIFYIPIYNLDIISGGKCHLKTTTSVSSEVVCDL